MNAEELRSLQRPLKENTGLNRNLRWLFIKRQGTIKEDISISIETKNALLWSDFTGSCRKVVCWPVRAISAGSLVGCAGVTLGSVQQQWASCPESIVKAEASWITVYYGGFKDVPVGVRS